MLKPIFEYNNLLMIYVRWNDSSEDHTNYHGKDDDMDVDYVLTTVGYLFRETDEHLIVATDWIDKQQRGHIMQNIRKDTIIEVRIIEAKKARRSNSWR